MVPLLECKAVEFSYPERSVLKGIDLRIGEGEKIGLTGPNGAGKTTLLRIFMGLERPQAGEILFRGKPCQSEEDWRKLRREVGLVFQDPDDQLFCPTVEEDLAFGPLNLGISREEVKQRVRTTLEQLGLKGFEKRITYRLSGGEKRLIALGTVLTMSPRLILLDEPTGDLDPQNIKKITTLLAALPVSLLVVSHDLEFLKAICQRIFCLKDGKLEAA